MNQLETLNRDIICEKLKSFAKDKKKLLIICHRNPDADTVGSAFALKLIYRALGGSAKCVCDSDAPKYLHFLYSSQETVNYRSNDDNRHDVFCAVDVASTEQLGRLDYLAEKVDFMVDHHGTGTPFAPCWVEPDASACAELICKIYRKLVLEGSIIKDADIARRLYAGISADCGSFKYSNTTPETHMLAASLIDDISKANDGKETHSEIAAKLFDSNSKEDLTAAKLTIEKIKYAADGLISYAVITSEDIQKAGIDEGCLGKSINILRSIDGILGSFVIKQQRDKSLFRVSTRSNCGLNVSEICAEFGGGGHAKASGATITADSPHQAEELMVKAFENAVDRYIKKERHDL